MVIVSNACYPDDGWFAQKQHNVLKEYNEPQYFVSKILKCNNEFYDFIHEVDTYF